jgi:hypothetical protein
MAKIVGRNASLYMESASSACQPEPLTTDLNFSSLVYDVDVPSTTIVGQRGPQFFEKAGVENWELNVEGFLHDSGSTTAGCILYPMLRKKTLLHFGPSGSAVSDRRLSGCAVLVEFNQDFSMEDAGAFTATFLSRSGSLTDGVWSDFMTTVSGNLTVEGTITVDVDDAEALLIRKDNDAGDVFVVDTVNSRVGIGITSPDGTLHVHEATAGAVVPSSTGDTLVVETNVAGGMSLLVPNSANANIYFGSPSDAIGALIRWNHNSGIFTVGSHKAGAETRIASGVGSVAIRIDSNSDVGIGSAPLAQLHVDQSSTTGGQPVAYFDQADISEEMFEFNTTIGIGNAIEAVGAKALTTTHFIKVTLPGGLTRYIPVGTIA